MGRARNWAFGLVIPWVGACGQSHTMDGDAAAQSEADTAALADAVCRYFERCLPGALMAYPQATVASCIRETQAQPAGLLRGDPRVTDLEACLRFLQDDRCTLGLVGGSAWVAPAFRFQPDFPEDSPCAPPRFEWDDADAAAEGEACFTMELSCKKDTYCAANQPLKQAGADFCGTCTALRPKGADCAPADRCEWGTRCNHGKCEPKRTLGEPCTGPDHCARGSCEDGRCMRPASERPIPSSGAALGAGCASFDLDACDRDPTLACVRERCVTRPDLAGACDGGGDCRVGQVCLEERCTEEPERAYQGQSCEQGQTCDEQLYCDLETLTCEPFPGLGEPCTFLCASGGVCTASRLCEVPRKDGANCSDDRQCVSHLCLRDILPFCVRSESGGVHCSIPQCTDCGICAPQPDISACK